MNNFSALVGIIAGIISIALAIPTFLEHIRKGLSKTALFLMSAAIVVVIGAGLYFSTSTTIIPHSPTNPFVSNATETPPATPSPAPKPQVIPINQTMSCTNCPATDPDYNFSLLVKSAMIDSVNSQVTLLIGVQNLSTTSQTEVEVSFLRFQDPQTGVTTNGAGGCFSSFPLAGQSTYFCRPTFQFVPVTEHEYSFSAGLLALGRATTYLFSPITIKL